MISELLGNPFRDSYYIGLYLGWLVSLIGLFVCVRGFQKTKAKAFFLIAIFFIQPFLGIIYHQFNYRLHKEEIDQYIEFKNKELQERLERGEVIETDSTVKLPVFEVILVMGMFFLVRSKKLNVEQVAGGNAAR
jgi:hypothetical protein